MEISQENLLLKDFPNQSSKKSNVWLSILIYALIQKSIKFLLNIKIIDNKIANITKAYPI